MHYRDPFKEVPLEPGASDRVKRALEDLPKINKERPCTNCIHYTVNRTVHCGLSLKACDFYHSAYKPIND